MKSVLIILSLLIFCSGSSSEDVLSSHEIQVTYMNYSENGDYESTDCFSNKKCVYSFHNTENKLVSVVNFKTEQIEMIASDPAWNGTTAFKEWESLEAMVDIDDPLYIPEFDVSLSEETKEICGIKCKKLIASDKGENYKIWYFVPETIKTERINAYTGYKQIPGIIMEMSKDGILIRKAIKLDDQCDW